MKQKIRIAAATPKIKVANCNHNTALIIELMKKADAQQVQLLCLPALCITGATCGDLFLQPTLINAAHAALNKLVESSKNMNMVIIVGLPTKNCDALHNSTAVLSKGEILSIAEDGAQLPVVCENIRGATFAVLLGNAEYSAGIPQIFVNPSAKNEVVGGFSKIDAAKHLSCGGTYVQACAGLGESTTDMVFAGRNIIAQDGEILAESPPFGDGWAVADVGLCESDEQLSLDKGHARVSPVIAGLTRNLQVESPRLDCTCANSEKLGFANSAIKIAGQARNDKSNCADKINDSPHPFISLCTDPEHALQIQTAGLATRLSHTNGTAVIGISGGLDSCLALLVTARAYRSIGRPVSDIVAVTLPCYGTTTHTKNNAHALCAALGIPCREIDITASVALHLQDIGHPPGQFDVVFENAQARMRTMVLMNIANQVNGLVIGTGSLSELALGWATYNGDHMSMYAVNAGVPKTLVRHLVEHVAKTSTAQLKKVLESILATKVSPELLPAPDGEIVQITEELVGPYELHDFFIYHALVAHRPPKEILSLATVAFAGKYPHDVILHWLRTFYRRFFSQQFKRNCLPDSPQVVPLSFSPRVGLHMPSDACAELWLAELE